MPNLAPQWSFHRSAANRFPARPRETFRGSRIALARIGRGGHPIQAKVRKELNFLLCNFDAALPSTGHFVDRSR
jgi:hypothetical protein